MSRDIALNLALACVSQRRRRERNLIKKVGFTLIELAISLVIIGFLIGGIIVGKDLIHAAEIRAQIGQFQEYDIAYNNYKLKYNCTAGDCATATSIFGTTDPTGTAINNGNGNDNIDTKDGASLNYNAGVNTWSASTEMWGVFQQLSLANMVSFTPKLPLSQLAGDSHPTTKLNLKSGFFFGASYSFVADRTPDISSYRKGTNILWFIHCNNNTGMNYFDDNCGIFLAQDLQQIDQKIDDGKPLSGKLLGFGGWQSGTNNNCLSGSGVNAIYNIIYTTPQCQAAYVVE